MNCAVYRCRVLSSILVLVAVLLSGSSGFWPARSEEAASPVLAAAERGARPPQPWDRDYIRKKPYLIYPGNNTTMTVLWQVYQTPQRATLEWGTTTSYGKGPLPIPEVGSKTDQHQFSHTIRGLTPGTKYHYRVVNDGYEHKGSFITAPPASATNVSFYGYGDSRPGFNGEPTDHNSVLTALLADMNANPDQRQTLLVHMGDYVFNGLNEFYWDLQQFPLASTYASMQTTFSSLPFMGVLGNHEGYDAYSKADCIFNFQNFGELFKKYYPYHYPNNQHFYYSFDYGPIHFVVIDSWTYWGATEEESHTIDNVQANWLKQNLRASRKPWKIAMLHMPIWGCEKSGEALQSQLTPILKEGGVQLVLQGHLHYYSRVHTTGPYSGMTYLTLGGGGAELNNPATTHCTAETNKVIDYTAFVFHFARFDVTGNTMTVTVTDNNGSLVEPPFQLPLASE